ncbi:MAG: S1 RNA-binding domain-containing protein, partial [Magnetococcales bacterium]|nr:S1 RNA-binding domain-containing protein [Magnetococcales bacterium]
MTKRMLVDATHPEEIRVAIVQDSKLIDLDIETSSREQIKGNIYLARVSRVEPSLQAAFIDFGGGRQGFLSVNDIHPKYYPSNDKSERSEFLPRPLPEPVDDDEGDDGLEYDDDEEEFETEAESASNRRSPPSRSDALAAQRDDDAPGEPAEFPPSSGHAAQAMPLSREESDAGERRDAPDSFREEDDDDDADDDDEPEESPASSEADESDSGEEEESRHAGDDPDNGVEI